MATETLSLTDCIYIKRSPSKDGPCQGQKQRQVLIYFIPGNPGLIGYYYDFLIHLASLLDPDGTNLVYQVVGHSLGGFELTPGANGVAQLHAMLSGAPTRIKPTPFEVMGLSEQGVFVMESLQATVEILYGNRSENMEPGPLSVVLVGHSVGAYLFMETLKTRFSVQSAKDVGMKPLSEGDNKDKFLENFRTSQRFEWVPDVDERFKLIGGVGLFPTIVDLAGSPRGRKASRLAKQTWFPYVLHYATYILKILPAFIVQKLVSLITKMPWTAANTTTSFLQSKIGVFQALYMARDEILQMTTDKWPPEVWNRYHPPTGSSVDRPQLYFFWGENDYWIDNLTRDKIIANHARKTALALADDVGRPYMEIDRTGIPHDFCIRPEHSECVAAKVYGFVQDAIFSAPSS